MGNIASQCVAAGSGSRARPLVVGPDGSRSWPEEGTGVAELMIDAPGYVVARAADVTKERRVRARAADELLRAGEVYLLVPAGRTGARLGDREVEAISRLVSGEKNSRKGRPGAGKRVFPEVNDEEVVVEGKAVGCASASKRAQVHGLGPRQWRPALDTIYEA
ncbi:uncharacterized protein LOC133909880 [Phragmites australis]|uniref:uncharacterized protein LOC133909880 n=1 Tax=Phragmites australis TaxID=29695 RepID=UPI002D76FBB3|nr:uncharacterized protein LOC133909880 [Phragmites australis]